MINTHRRERSHAAHPVGWKATLERCLCPPHIGFRVGKVDQLGGAEGAEQRLILTEETLEARATDLAFIEEGKARDADAGDQDRKPIGKIERPAHIALRQQFQFHAALRREEIDLGRFSDEHVRIEMVEDEVEHHEPGLDVGIALDAPVLRAGKTESGIDRLCRQVIDVPALPTLDDLDVPVAMGFREKASRHSAAFPMREAVILAAEKVAGMHGDQIQERGLASDIADSFERLNGVVVHRYNSRMFSMRCESSSIFAVRVARSEAEA